MANDSVITVHPELAFELLEARQNFERLFLFDVLGQYFIFRPLFVSECESITALANYIDSFVIDEWIVSKTIVSKNLGYLLTDAPAGLVNSLANSILKNSILESMQIISSELDKSREFKSGTNEMLDFMVKAGAGHILKDTKKITYKQQIDYTVFAEQLLGKKLELVDPNNLPKDNKGRVRRLSPQAAAILSKEAADKPDFAADNAAIMGR